MKRLLFIIVAALLAAGCQPKVDPSPNLEHLTGAADTLTNSVSGTARDVADIARQIQSRTKSALGAAMDATVRAHVTAIQVLATQLEGMDGRFEAMQVSIATIKNDAEAAKTERSKLLAKIDELQSEFRKKMDRYAALFILLGIAGVGVALFLKQTRWAVIAGVAAVAGTILTRVARAFDEAVPLMKWVFVGLLVVSLLWLIIDWSLRWRKNPKAGPLAAMKSALMTDPITDLVDLFGKQPTTTPAI